MKGMKLGPPGVLSIVEEDELMTYIKNMQDREYPLNPTQLRLKVAQMIRMMYTPFTNGIPGRGWMQLL